MCGTVGATIIAMSMICLLIGPSEQHVHHHSNPPAEAGHVPDVDNKLRDPKVVQDANHIKEHMQDMIDVKDEDMSPEELEFHYFRLHDTDNNTMLDGLEILSALSHMMPADDIVDPINPEKLHGKTADQIAEMERERKEQIMNYYVGIIDQVLLEDDYNGDGYLTYVEYVLARRRDEHRYKKQKDQEEAKKNKNNKEQAKTET